MIFWVTQVQSAPTIITPEIDSISKYFHLIEDISKTYKLNVLASVYEDASDTLSIMQIQNKKYTRFSDLKLSVDINSYWVKLTIKNNLDYTSDWRLHLFEGWCEKVKVYSKSRTLEANNNKENWFEQDAGYLTPLKNLDHNPKIKIQARKVPNAVSLQLLPAEEKLIYIRYQRKLRATIQINLELIPMIAASNKLIDFDRSSFFTIVFIGMFCVLAFYHFLVFIMIGDKIYLFYALYSGCAAFACTIMDEYGILNYHLYYSSHPSWQPWIFIWIGTSTIAFYILFTRSFLDTKIRFPKLDNSLLILLITGIIFSIISSINLFLTGRQYLPFMPFSAYMLSLVFIFALIMISVWRKKQTTDLFYFWGVGLMLMVIIPIHFFDLLNIEVPNVLIVHGLPISILLVGVLIELLVFSLGLGYRTRLEILDKQRYEELDLLKSQFFTNITHEFRTPLTLIMGPLQSIKSKLSVTEDLNLIQMAQNNAKRLLSLVNQVMDLSKLESKNVKLEVEYIDIIPYLRGVFYLFESLANQKNVTLNFRSTEKGLLVYCDPKKMETIITNILSNAINFSNDGGIIDFDVDLGKNTFNIKIRDTGVGILPENIPFVFDRFYQGPMIKNSNRKGSGIGLALVRELVLLHQGTIEVKSKLSEGTLFEISLPLGKTHLKVQELRTHDAIMKKEKKDNDEFKNSKEQTRNTKTVLEVKSTVTKSEVILLIEDNSDVRSFIKSHLSIFFKIEEAENGSLGIEKAISLLPDLIVSDVMMPEKDGYEVCAYLKNDIRTSHIPIILLTAKAEIDERIEGLQSGADDYLVKPFDSKELEVRIRNLIRIRKELRTRYAESITIRPSEVSANTMDQQFMEKALNTIEKHMSNEDFSIDIMTQELGMSATQLNHKLRALIDKSTNQFIKSIRLQRAADLIQNNAGTISEIAFQTGFRSAAYFTTSFKSHFGATPKSYKEKYAKD